MKRRGFLGMIAGLALLAACGVGFQPATCEANPKRTPIQDDGVTLWLVVDPAKGKHCGPGCIAFDREISVCVDGNEVGRAPFNEDPVTRRMSDALLEVASQQHDAEIVGRLVSKANQYIRIGR